MPASRAFCIDQLKRLVGLDFFPKNEPSAIRELIRTVMDTVNSDEQFERIVDFWLHTETRFPKPCEFRKLAKQIPIVADLPPVGCEGCGGTGWAHAIRGGYSGCAHCDCALGQYRWRLAELRGD